MTKEKEDYKTLYETANAVIEAQRIALDSRNRQLVAAFDMIRLTEAELENKKTSNALEEKKLIEYEKKISEFNKLKWYQKLKYKF